MTSPNDTELWTALSRQWQTFAHDGEDSVVVLRAYVDRHRRRLRWLRLLDFGVTAAALVAAGWFLLIDGGAFGILTAIDTLVILVIVWTFSIVTGRGLARASTSTTAEYLALARRFARRRLQTVHLALALLVAQAIVVGLLFPSIESPPRTPFRFLPIGGAIAWLGWAFITRRRALRELDAIDDVEGTGRRAAE